MPKPIITKQVLKPVEQSLTLVENSNETKKEVEPTTTNKLKNEDEIFLKIKDFLKNSENTFSAQKNDLVNLINETITEKHAHLKSQIEQIVETKFDKIKNYNSNNYNYNPEHMLLLSKALNQPRQDILPVNNQVIPKVEAPQQQQQQQQQVQKKERKGKYFPLPSDLWRGLREKYPDLPEDAADKAYIRDDIKYIKLKTGYVELTDSGVARVVAYLKKNN